MTSGISDQINISTWPFQTHPRAIIILYALCVVQSQKDISYFVFVLNAGFARKARGEGITRRAGKLSKLFMQSRNWLHEPLILWPSILYFNEHMCSKKNSNMYMYTSFSGKSSRPLSVESQGKELVLYFCSNDKTTDADILRLVPSSQNVLLISFSGCVFRLSPWTSWPTWTARRTRRQRTHRTPGQKWSRRLPSRKTWFTCYLESLRRRAILVCFKTSQSNVFIPHYL